MDKLKKKQKTKHQNWPETLPYDCSAFPDGP